MKNLKTFESYTQIPLGNNTPVKKYGDNYPFSNLKVGDRVIYMGAPYNVETVDEYLLLLKSERDGRITRVNQKMFNDGGFIPAGNSDKQF